MLVRIVRQLNENLMLTLKLLEKNAVKQSECFLMQIKRGSILGCARWM